MVDAGAHVILASIYHDDVARRQNQARVATEVRKALELAGIAVFEANAHHQPDFRRSESSAMRYSTALLHSWRQDIFNLQEARRRRGDSSPLPIRKKLRALRRVLRLGLKFQEHSEILVRRNIEGALSEKHIHIWRTLANSNALGAVVLEDDVVLPTREGANHLARLVAKYGSLADFIDLAGGFSRIALGLPTEEDGDLELSYMLANTTAGYFIGRDAAVALVDYLYFEPQARYLGSDFLVGMLNDLGFRGTTIIPGSLPLRHGSMEGDFEGLIPY